MLLPMFAQVDSIRDPSPPASVPLSVPIDAMKEVTLTTRSFGLFPYLNDDLKVSVLSFIAVAPFESMINYPQSTLTHTLPQVSKKFRVFSQSDLYWKDAVFRQVAKEPFLWKEGLCRIVRDASECQTDEELVEKARLEKFSYKNLYKDIVSEHLRFKGPVFFMPGSLQLGEPYGLHFFEPRYRLLIAETMRDQPESAKHGGRVTGEAIFLHANRAPLAPTTPAVLVKVVQCDLFNDGRADVLLLPTAHVWIEKLWTRPNSGNLIYAQCLRMGKTVSADMNKLSRQEVLAHVMVRLAGQMEEEGYADDMTTSDDDDDEEETDDE